MVVTSAESLPNDQPTITRVGRGREFTLGYILVHVLWKIARLLTRLGIHIVDLRKMTPRNGW